MSILRMVSVLHIVTYIGGYSHTLSGGYPKFISQGLNDNYLPVWLQEAGYNTYYTGKLFNVHTVDNYNAPFPAGFTGNVSHPADFLFSRHSNMSCRTSSSIHSHTTTLTVPSNETTKYPKATKANTALMSSHKRHIASSTKQSRPKSPSFSRLLQLHRIATFS